MPGNLLVYSRVWFCGISKIEMYRMGIHDFHFIDVIEL